MANDGFTTLHSERFGSKARLTIVVAALPVNRSNPLGGFTARISTHYYLTARAAFNRVLTIPNGTAVPPGNRLRRFSGTPNTVHTRVYYVPGVVPKVTGDNRFIFKRNIPTIPNLPAVHDRRRFGSASTMSHGALSSSSAQFFVQFNEPGKRIPQTTYLRFRK